MFVWHFLTLKASPLSNRGCTAPPDKGGSGAIDPVGVASLLLLGHSFRVLALVVLLSAGPSDAAVTER